jgi:hypothetical protein
MSENLIPIKAYLGKYHTELAYSAAQAKYANTRLDSFFEQRFYIQNNKVQMVVEPNIKGLVINVIGNEIHVSQELYDHPNILITNSMESGQTTNPKSLYNPEVFSTLAYLVCQNHTSFNIVADIDEPIYVKYTCDYETFYNSVLVFSVAGGLDVEIVEEFESVSALNAVTNYILYPSAKLNLTTFYNNHLSGLSFAYRNVIAQQSSKFNHILYGRGSSNVIDENKIFAGSSSETEMLGIVNSEGMNFHSILYVESEMPDYRIAVNYRDILEDKHNVTFFPVILGITPLGDNATIEVSNVTIEELPINTINTEINKFISDIVDRTVLDRMVGVERFYNNKTKFLQLL